MNKQEFIKKAEEIFRKSNEPVLMKEILEALYQLHIEGVREIIENKQKELNYTQNYECGGVLNQILEELTEGKA